MPKIKMKFRTATVTETFESFLKASGVVDKTTQSPHYIVIFKSWVSTPVIKCKKTPKKK
jgi:hypothetical protein